MIQNMTMVHVWIDAIREIQERFDNLLCGWTFTIGVKVVNDFSTCDIPVNPRGAGY